MSNHYRIFNYWKDQKLPNGDAILHDYGEPMCWACNKPIDVETQKDLDKGNLKAIWNKTQSKLNKCHIIPRALGGNESPGNLFLMCENCHFESPDTNKPELFFNWLMDKRERCIMGVDTLYEQRAWEDAARAMGIESEVIMENIYRKIGPLTHENIKKILEEKGITINTHGFKFSSTTIKMALIQAMVE